MRKSTSGFTLVEILIVIVIIGILAAALVPRLTSAQSKARDLRRKTDLMTIHKALRIFYEDNGRMPYHKDTQTDCGGNTLPRADSKGTCGGKRLTNETGFYAIITAVPVDPLNTSYGSYAGSWVAGNNVYNYLNGKQRDANNPSTYFDLVGQLENRNDPDRCEVKQYRYHWDMSNNTWCGGYTNMLYSTQP